MNDRIVLVEDDLAILRGLSDNIRAEGYEVLGANDGETGYRLIRDHQPDLILLDVMLPGLGGIEVCRRVRGEGVRTPIVMLTANASEQERVSGLDAGADDYVTKPFLLAELLARIRGLLKHRREWSKESDRLQRDVRAAAEVQQRLLPQCKPASETLDCAGSCAPALGVGGDYYDFIDVAPGLTALVLADVAGKGITAALSMACIHGIVRTEAPRCERHCAHLVAKLNSTLIGTMQPGRYSTLFYGVYEDRSRLLTYVNAGHPPPIVVRADGSVVSLDAAVPPVGLFPAIAPREDTVRLHPGDWLCVYSDGVTEAIDANGDEFGRERLVDVIVANAALSSEAMVAVVRLAVNDHTCGQPPFDDLTVIAGRVR
jgi:sigma-B regulation protein RsbU (phosphoserine phosphatase)